MVDNTEEERNIKIIMEEEGITREEITPKRDTEFVLPLPPIKKQLLRDIRGLLKSGDTAPTYVPRNFSEQFFLYKSGSTYRLYVYISDAWTSFGDTDLFIAKDGSVTFTANQPMGGFKLTGLAAGTGSGDSVRYEQVVRTSGIQTVNGVKTFGSFLITPSSAPTTNYQVANKKYVDDSAGATYTAGDKFLWSDDLEEDITTSYTSYTKLKELEVQREGGAFRIKFDLKKNGGTSVSGRIYKNGAAVGTERTNATTSYVTYSEDLSGFVEGDLIQLYVKAFDGASAGKVENFRIYVAYTEIQGNVEFTQVVSDNLRHSNDTQRSTGSVSLVKLKEIVLNEDLDNVRIKFQLSTTGGDAVGRIYKNGVAVGTEQIGVGVHSEDFADFVNGDLIQVYVGNSGGGNTTNVTNFRLYWDRKISKLYNRTLTTALPVDEPFDTAPTNQDPV